MIKNNYTVLFKLLSNNLSGNSFNAEIILKNNTKSTLKNWKLCLDFFRPSPTHPIEIAEKNKFKLTKNIAEYCEITGLVDIPSAKSISIRISGNWFIRKYSDTPSCYFLVIGNKKPIEVFATSDFGKCILPEIPAQKINPPPVKDFNPAKLLRLIPAPLKTVFHAGQSDFSGFDKIADTVKSKDSASAVKTFLECYKPLINGNKLSRKNKQSGSSITIRADTSLASDCYTLDISRNIIIIEANSRGGYLYALISLFKIADAYKNKIPCVRIEDGPGFAYRGMLVDMARSFRTVAEIKKHMKMMAMYKMNVFHCRLVDDEGWRIQIKKYPNITDIGAFRGYGEIIPSFHGSGPKKTGGFYTQKEITELINFANNLNITFIPEIVVPSHSRALIMSFTGYKGKENPLIEKADKSSYVTPQAFTDNILNPALDFSYQVVEEIFKEICSLFFIQKKRNMPFGDFIHIGADEVPHGAWMGSPACKKLMKKYGLKTTEELQHYFIRKLQDIIEKHGCKAAGWEESIKGGEFPSKEFLVYSWMGEKAGFEAAGKGFPVVMAPVQYLYFDLAYTQSPEESGLYWGGFSNPKIIYSYEPIPNSCSAKVRKNIKGIQCCLWSELLGKPKRANTDKYPENFVSNPMEYMAFPKMTAFSEVSWSASENRNWNAFIKKYEYEKNILDKFEIKYRKNNIE